MTKECIDSNSTWACVQHTRGDTPTPTTMTVCTPAMPSLIVLASHTPQCHTHTSITTPWICLKYIHILMSLKMFSQCMHILTPTNTSMAHIHLSTNYLYTITHNWQSLSLTSCLRQGFPRHTAHENYETQIHFKLHNTQQQWRHTILTTLYNALKILLGNVVTAMLI